MYSKQLHFLSWKEKRETRENKWEKFLCYLPSRGNCTPYLLENATGSCRSFISYISLLFMYHGQGVFISAFLNLLSPHLHAHSPIFRCYKWVLASFPIWIEATILASYLHQSPLSTNCLSKVIKVLTISEAKTTRPQKLLYIAVRSTEGIEGSQLELGRIAGFSIVAGRHQVPRHVCHMALQRSLLLKCQNSQGEKCELNHVLRFLCHACISEVGNRRRGSGNSLAVPRACSAAHSRKTLVVK